jgi:diaminopimelate decarboxylase
MTGATEPDRLPAVAAALRLAASRFGTPLYLTDVATLDAAATAVRDAFPDPWLRQYSVKANDVAAIVRLVADRGFGANVVSRGEWAVARKAGVPDRDITFEGIGKTDADLGAAIRGARDGTPLRWLALESIDEARALASIAKRAATGRRSPPLDLLFRLNPDVAPETHRGLAVGAGGSKFGMTEADLSEAVAIAAGAKARGSRGAGLRLRPRGIHLHVGSQLGAVDAWRDAVRRGLALLGLLRGSLPEFDTLDVGGGFPVGPLGEPAPSPARFGRELPELLAAIPPDRRPSRLAIEPGRFLVARAGWLVARVLHVRERDGRRVVIDAGMTELIRPALYGARHDVIALTSMGRPFDGSAAGMLADGHAAAETLASGLPIATVEGPICESTDELGDHPLPPLQRGDLVAIRDAGAYAASQSSAYNGRPRPPQVLLEADGSLVLVRRRGSRAALG